MWTPSLTKDEHPFDLSQDEAGDEFIGCLRCGFRLPKEVKAAAMECPVCLGEMRIFTVTKYDKQYERQK